MRTLTDHRVNECNEAIDINVIDDPGAGGAHHEYVVVTNPGKPNSDTMRITFQNGPVKEVGTNGLTQEALLAIVADRLRSFQSGQYACRENALALTKIEEAMHWLQHRTRARVARGVEGTHVK